MSKYPLWTDVLAEASRGQSEIDQPPANWRNGFKYPLRISSGETPFKLDNTWYIRVFDDKIKKPGYYNYSTDIMEPEKDVMARMPANKCEVCRGSGQSVTSFGKSCDSCHGTGHNLGEALTGPIKSVGVSPIVTKGKPTTYATVASDGKSSEITSVATTKPAADAEAQREKSQKTALTPKVEAVGSGVNQATKDSVLLGLVSSVKPSKFMWALSQEKKFTDGTYKFGSATKRGQSPSIYDAYQSAMEFLKVTPNLEVVGRYTRGFLGWLNDTALGENGRWPNDDASQVLKKYPELVEANEHIQKFVVRRTPSGQWDVVDVKTGKVVEGGFFSQAAAREAAIEWDNVDTESGAQQEGSFGATGGLVMGEKDPKDPKVRMEWLIDDVTKPVLTEAIEPKQIEHFTIAQLARLVQRDWRNVNFGARPYLDAMFSLDVMAPRDGHYYQDTGESVVAYFISNATTWRGENAKVIKKELKRRLSKSYRAPQEKDILSEPMVSEANGLPDSDNLDPTGAKESTIERQGWSLTTSPLRGTVIRDKVDQNNLPCVMTTNAAGKSFKLTVRAWDDLKAADSFKSAWDILAKKLGLKTHYWCAMD